MRKRKCYAKSPTNKSAPSPAPTSTKNMENGNSVKISKKKLKYHHLSLGKHFYALSHKI